MYSVRKECIYVNEAYYLTQHYQLYISSLLFGICWNCQRVSSSQSVCVCVAQYVDVCVCMWIRWFNSHRGGNFVSQILTFLKYITTLSDTLCVLIPPAQQFSTLGSCRDYTYTLHRIVTVIGVHGLEMAYSIDSVLFMK